MLGKKTKVVCGITIPDISAAEIDSKVASVLRAMEQRGILIDRQKLTRLEKRLTKEVAIVQKKIVDLAGTEINLDSPKQLGQLLFDTLQIPTDGIKKTKHGYSTDADQLRILANHYPIASLLLTYRELTKLLSTYIRPLPTLVDSAGRLHTSYAPDTTSGRLSSRNPNLQNIPIRTETGRLIRTAFIAPKGKVLIKADYSQMELRIAACLANEPAMIAAFEQGIDIHRQTAAEVFHKAVSKVTDEERRFAKTINFGVLYGMGAHGLSVTLGISRAEAQGYIDQYFLTHAALRSYIDHELVVARKTGRVKSIFGRVREIAELKSPIDQIRRAGERMAINMPIQGMEAELLKLAMIELDPQLARVKANLLLTVHDELIIEAPQAQAPAVAKLVKSTMESVVQLCVPLIVEVSIGKSWGAMKPC